MITFLYVFSIKHQQNMTNQQKFKTFLKIAYDFISIYFNGKQKVMKFFIYNATIHKITV